MTNLIIENVENVKDFSCIKFIDHEYHDSFDSDNIKLIVIKIPKTDSSLVSLFAPQDKDFLFVNTYLLLQEQILLWGTQLNNEHDRTVKRELKKIRYPFTHGYLGASGLGKINFFAPTEKLPRLFEYFKHQLDVFGSQSLFNRSPKKYPDNEQAKNELLFIEKFYLDNNLDLVVHHDPLGPTLSYVISEISHHIWLPTDLSEISEFHMHGVKMLNELSWPFHYRYVVSMLKDLFNDRYIFSHPLYKDHPNLPLKLPKLSTSFSNSKYIKAYAEGLVEYAKNMIIKYESVLFYNDFLF